MCRCATKVDESLKGQNYVLVRNILDGDAAAAIVEITKIKSSQRTPSMSLVATFCPFCGKRYPERKSRGVLKTRGSVHARKPTGR